MNDLYEELQVSSKAEPEVIEAAFRRLARKYHPDVSGDPASSERMRRLAYAYEVLSDPRRRAAYDNVRRDGVSSAPAGTAPAGWPPRSRTLVLIGVAAVVMLVLLVSFVPAARPLLARGLVVAAGVALVLWLVYALVTRRS
jgi:preprotein translocase subunit Sec63